MPINNLDKESMFTFKCSHGSDSLSKFHIYPYLGMDYITNMEIDKEDIQIWI